MFLKKFRKIVNHFFFKDKSVDANTPKAQHGWPTYAFKREITSVSVLNWSKRSVLQICRLRTSGILGSIIPPPALFQNRHNFLGSVLDFRSYAGEYIFYVYIDRHIHSIVYNVWVQYNVHSKPTILTVCIKLFLKF